MTEPIQPFTERAYSTKTLCLAAEWKPSDFRTCRNRHDLFPQTLAKGEGKKLPWNTFSFVDICVARTVALLIGGGFGAKEAVDLSDKWLRLQFTMVLEDLSNTEASGEAASTAAICFGSADGHPNGVHVLMLKDGDAVSFIRERGERREIGVYVDFLAIIKHVRNRLAEIDPETVPTRKEVFKIVTQALVKGITEGGEDD
ncbi:MAG: hypothetical protein HQL36_01960 [Alphaproteobacteria bacterium]|nr:hypothetical protein [Alphaproteobacteria bacterium]